MSAATEQARVFRALVKRVLARHDGAAPGPPAEDRPRGADPITFQLVYSMLLWEASSAKATPALRRLNQSVVDYNELRVCLPYELAEVLGPRYPRVDERTERLHAVLNDVYAREHAVSLAHLAEMSKRDAKVYLETLEGATHYVTSRVLALSLGAHAVPVDSQLLARLIAEGVLNESYDVVSAGNWLERQLHAGEAAAIHAALQAWVETPSRKRSKSRARAKSSARRSPRAGGTSRRKKRAGDSTDPG